ncbi:MAG: PAS domain-containing protein [Cyanobacteriota bacterium ELA615]
MNPYIFNFKFQVSQVKLNLLSKNIDELLLQPELLKTVLEELSMVLEELQVQQEELLANQSQLESSYRFYQEFFDCAPNGYLITNEEGVIEQVNQSVANILKIRQDFIIGKPLSIFIAPSDRNLFFSQLNKFLQSEKLAKWQLNLRTRQEQMIPVNLQVSKLEQENGPPKLRWEVQI